MNLTRTTHLIILLIAIVFILIVGKGIMIQLVLAGLVWFLVKEIRNLFKRIPFIKKSPSWLLNLLAVLILSLAIGGILDLLITNIEALTEKMMTYEDNLNSFITSINTSFNIDLKTLWNNHIGDFDISAMLSELLTSLTGFLSNIFMIALYLLFLLLEESSFSHKLIAMYPDKKRLVEIQATFKKISDSFGSYISLKTLVSLMTGALSYIALAIIGIDSPLFWAFLIFLLNFIPTIGSLIATVFPALMAVLQFGDFNTAIIVLVTVGAIQVVIGNIVEPKIMGNSLNVSSFVVILALSLWGSIWGITGMVLSVPITVILVILFSQFESTKKIAILLSEKGNVD